MLMVTPEKYISTTAKITLMGMEHRVMKVGRMSRRNKNRIMMANRAPSSKLLRMLFTIMWM